MRSNDRHHDRGRAIARNPADAMFVDDKYDTLRLVADLVARMTESISHFLDEPIRWTRPPVDGHEEQTSVSQVRRLVSVARHDMAIRRLVQDHLGQWRTAYDFSGAGSTFRRARTIEGIYGDAAPLPDAVMPPPSKEFLMEVRQIVTRAIEASGGRVELESDS